MLWIALPLGVLTLFASLFLRGAGASSRTYAYGVLDPMQKHFTYSAAVLAVVDGLMCFFVSGTPLEWWVVGLAVALILFTVVVTATWWYRVSLVGRPASQKKTT
ncbi:MAG: hypothetical protein WA030_01870 [Candidatus Microsaccharimonas sp.]